VAPPGHLASCRGGEVPLSRTTGSPAAPGAVSSSVTHGIARFARLVSFPPLHASPPSFVSCSFFGRPTGYGGPSSTSTALRHVGRLVVRRRPVIHRRCRRSTGRRAGARRWPICGRAGGAAYRAEDVSVRASPSSSGGSSRPECQPGGGTSRSAGRSSLDSLPRSCSPSPGRPRPPERRCAGRVRQSRTPPPVS